MKKTTNLLAGALVAGSIALVPLSASAFFGGGPGWGGWGGGGYGWGGYGLGGGPWGWGGYPGYGGWGGYGYGGYPYALTPQVIVTQPATVQQK